VDGSAPFSQAERQKLRELTKDVVNGGRISTWNADGAGKYLPLIQMAVMVMGRESAEILTMPYEGGFLEQPTRTMQALAVVQEVFAERLRQEYEKGKRGGK
jgi:hypothetical protein